MFSGIIEELGKVKKITTGAYPRIEIGADKILEDLKKGDSIAVNGVCLTVISRTDSSFEADIMPETLYKTNLRKLKKREMVNLERALKVGERIGGHYVSGHIDGVGVIRRKIPQKNASLLWITLPERLSSYIAPQGSIAVDGVSLTIVDVNSRAFSVSIIPYTATNTTLGLKQVGSEVNIEVDLIARYVCQYMSQNRYQRHEVAL